MNCMFLLLNFKRVVSFGMVLFVLGCVQSKVALQGKGNFSQWRIKADDSHAYSPVLPDIDGGEDDFGLQQLLPQFVQPAKQDALPKQKVTLVMRGSDIGVVLRALGRAVGQNLLVSDSVKGAININLQDVAWNQAFLGIVKTYGLCYSWQGDVISVQSMEDFAKELRYTKLLNEKNAMDKQVARNRLLVKTVKIKFCDIKRLGKCLQKILHTQPEAVTVGDATVVSSIQVDELNNLLIIHATKEETDKLLYLIKHIDKPSAQVLIEAMIVITNKETARDLGVQWGGLRKFSNGGSNVWITPGVQSGWTNEGNKQIHTNSINGSNNSSSGNSLGVLGETLSGAITPNSGMMLNLPADLSGGSGMALGLAYEKVGHYLLNTQLTALENAGKIEVLSTPSISTLDNQTAFIESGSEIPYQSTSANSGTDTEFKKAVLRMEVTPHVINNELVRLKIMTSNDDPDYSRVDSGITSEPAITTQRAGTTVMLFDGQTTVIGGMSKEYKSGHSDGVPWLSKIPLLGYLFKSKSHNERKEELLIFITPHILKPRVLNNNQATLKSKKTE